MKRRVAESAAMPCYNIFLRSVMKVRMREVLISCFFFMFGNYVYQWVQAEPDMIEATTRSFFQLAIVLWVWFRLRNTVEL